jgi:hypothetical protein
MVVVLVVVVVDVVVANGCFHKATRNKNISQSDASHTLPGVVVVVDVG